jgi:hypothetical protein
MGDHGERALAHGNLVFEVTMGKRLVLRLDAGAASGTIELPYLPGGYGGHELVVSPDERYLALYLYSGQSQQGWELFELAPQLRHLPGLPYVRGMGDAVQFSPDGAWLVMLVRNELRARDSGAYYESLCDPHADGSAVIDLGHVYVQRVPDGAIERFAVGATLPLALDFDEVSEWELYDALRFTSPSRFEISLPWGERVACQLPVTALPLGTFPAR